MHHKNTVKQQNTRKSMYFLKCSSDPEHAIGCGYPLPHNLIYSYIFCRTEAESRQTILGLPLLTGFLSFCQSETEGGKCQLTPHPLQGCLLAAKGAPMSILPCLQLCPLTSLKTTLHSKGPEQAFTCADDAAETEHSHLNLAKPYPYRNNGECVYWAEG